MNMVALLTSRTTATTTFLTRSLTSNFTFISSTQQIPPRVLLGFKPLCSKPTSIIEKTQQTPNPTKQTILLERLRLRHLKDGGGAKTPSVASSSFSRSRRSLVDGGNGDGVGSKVVKTEMVLSFEELGLSNEVMGVLDELGISSPTEIQCIGIPAVLDGKSVFLGSHTGSGKTLTYLLPIVQLLRGDEEISGIQIKPRRPRAVILCPTRELSEQVFRVAKSISHHARFRSTMVSGGGRLRPQEDSLNLPIDMVVGTPGRILQHIEDGNMVFGDIKYLVLDEADTMFDHGFGADIRKFLAPLKNRATKPDDPGFQTVLVAATMTKAVQKLIDDEFQGITHLRTSTLHKKVASARHDFIKLTGSENKLEALLQVLEPSLAKGNKVMVFCNTLDSSRAVDHFLRENQVYTVNYHGEVPADQRVENLNKFKKEDGDCPTLVCTDLAARGLDLDVDHVIMFDFPRNSVDYLHRTGRTARMGAKGKVTSLVTKRDLPLATRIEEAMKKNESLESLSVDSVRRDIARTRITQQKAINTKVMKASSQRGSSKATTSKSSVVPDKLASIQPSGKKTSGNFGKVRSQSKVKHGKVVVQSKSAKKSFKGSKLSGSSTSKKPGKMAVIGFRGRSSSSRDNKL